MSDGEVDHKNFSPLIHEVLLPDSYNISSKKYKKSDLIYTQIE
jgi:hypothetical protein